jgi:uncharacterized damage-inducible protein DinB
MSIAQATLAEFEHEAATTRKFLERVPADKLAWRPHAKSHTIGELARHIAQLPGAIVQMLTADQGVIPDEKTLFPQPAGVQEILDAHDQSVATVRKILPTLTDEQLQTNWTAIVGGRPVATMPKGMVLRVLTMNHWIHHRGQLGVHLRLAGAKVPQSYGPTADE